LQKNCELGRLGAHLKIGRNERCPCGSGKKYKKCHGGHTGRADAIRQVIQKQTAAERIRQNQQGLGRPIISLRAGDRQVIAVGNTLYHSANWKTFSDFLSDYMKKTLGEAWGAAEIAKPLTERHSILQWYDALCRYQLVTVKERGKVHAAPITGVVACYLGTAYSLYLLNHNVALQHRLVKRLKDPTQFQGAYYELIIANILIRAGFELVLEDETDGETKHCEFAAISKRTKKRYWVEAKMRGVAGLLGRTEKDGTSDPNPMSRLIPHLNAALKKPATDDRLIFIDLNCDPILTEEGKPDWFERVEKRLEQFEQKELSKGQSAYVMVTNLAFHRGLGGPLEGAAVPFGLGIADFNRPGKYRLFEVYKMKRKHIDAHEIGEALLKYPQLPATFDGSLPSEAFHGDRSRVIIGETYYFEGAGKDGGDLIAKVTSASVDEHKKRVMVGTDTGKILSYEMSDAALADYKENLEAYFGRVEASSKKELKTPYELFEWLMAVQKDLKRDVLLERLAAVPGVHTLSDDELLGLYCEGLVAGIEAKKSATPEPPKAT
jgi:hypothetical protein